MNSPPRERGVPFSFGVPKGEVRTLCHQSKPNVKSGFHNCRIFPKTDGIVAKTASRRLFDLVRTLSPSERRHFTRYANSHAKGSPKYRQLFDLMLRQEVFDDAALSRRLYPELPPGAKKFTELKAYLYDLILAALRSYDEKSSVAYRLGNALLNLRTLFRRARYGDCWTLLRKTEKLARRYEDYSTLLDLLSWEKRLIYAEATFVESRKRLLEIETRERSYLERSEEVRAYQNLFFQTLLFIRRTVLKQPEGETFLSKLPEHPLLRTERTPVAFRAQIYCLKIRSFYEYVHRDYQRFHTHNQSLLDLFEQRPELIREEPGEYVAVINNQIIAAGYLKKYDEVEALVERIGRYSSVTKYEARQAFRTYYDAKLRLHIQRGEFREGLETLHRQQRDFEKHRFTDIRPSSYYFQYFYLYFGNEEYGTALDYLNEWLNLPRSQARRDLQSLARILNLLTHFEMGNYVLLESLVRATERYQSKLERVSKVERSVTQTVRAAYQLPGKRERQPVFIKLGKELTQLKKIPEERSLLELFDLESWVAAHVERRSFASVVAGKFRADHSDRTGEAT